MGKYVRDNSHCKHTAYTKEEIDNLLQTLENKLETLATQDYVTNIVNEKTQPEVITIGINEEQEMLTTTQYYYINSDVVLSQAGTKFKTATFTLAEQTAVGVEIPEGVHKVKASGNVQIINNNETSDMYFVSYIYKLNAKGGSTAITRTTSPTMKKGGAIGMSLSSICVDVEPGDILFLYAFKTITAGMATIAASPRTYLTVEAVG